MSSSGASTSILRPQHRKFLLGGILIVVAIIYLIASTTYSTSHYYYTVDELNSKGAAAVGENVRISGAVLGKSIIYNPDSLELRFTIAHVPGQQREVDAQGGLAAVLHQAVSDSNATRLDVTHNGPMPDLLRNEAQAIMDGYLNDDGIFVANTLLLKCPTKYDDELPEQVNG
jgi:cytochrome c-type biogenesis protein CcmE